MTAVTEALERSVRALLTAHGPCRPNDCIEVLESELGLSGQEARDVLWQLLDLGVLELTRDAKLQVSEESHQQVPA